MSYTFTRFNSPNYTVVKNRKPKFIVIHHWDDPKKKPSFEGVVNWLCRTRGTSSAHYVVEAGRVAQLVPTGYVAWHAGDWQANRDSIGIECSPYATDGDYETVAELIREIRKSYGDLPLYPHKKFYSTTCPGAWDLKLLDQMVRGQGTPKKVAKPAGSKIGKSGDTGQWPNKPLVLSDHHTAESHRAWVKLLSDVGFKDKTLTVAMQKWLKKLGYYKRNIDGIFGYYTVVALQQFLKDRDHYTRNIDGQRGKHTINGEKKYLNDQRKYY